MAKEKAKVEEATDNHEGKVRVFLFKDNNLYRDDVFVCVNGRKEAKIPRGKEVWVDPAIAEALRLSQEQDAATADLQNKCEKEYETGVVIAEM